jgi:hypothetical protein
MVSGGCLCGAVRYEADGEPLFSVLCCCRDCQKASGAAYVPVMGMARHNVRVTGETRNHAIIGGSGDEVVRHFRPVCGSLLFGGLASGEGTINLYIGTLDDPSVFRPTAAIFTRSRPDWDKRTNDIPNHTALPNRA